MHTAGLLALLLLSPYITIIMTETTPVKVTVSREPFTFRVRTPIYLAQQAAAHTEAKRIARPPREAFIPPAVPPEPAQPRTAVRQFQLPADLKPVRAEQTILLPELTIPERRRQSDIRLPNVVFWSAETKAIPKPAPRQAVLPGRTNAPGPPPEPIAPPLMEAPNSELSIAGIKMAGGIATTKTPALSMPPSTTMPVQTSQRAGVAEFPQPPSMDRQAGEPAQAIALNQNPAPFSETVSIPRMAQMGRLPPAAGEAGAAAGPGDAGGGHGGANGRDPAGALPATANVTGRMTHSASGVFDIVVVNSSAPAAGETAALLSGKPTYTVYLRIGAPKEWILQYCIAKSGNRLSGAIVQLTAPKPLAAPYPRVTVTPPEAMLARNVKTALHGFLTEAGQFRDLTATRGEDVEFTAAVMPFLRQWEFRPASKDGVPVEVEVVLVIPAN